MRATSFRLLAVLILVSASHSSAQTANFATPSLGYVFDKEAHGIRPIRGLPGAATLGDTLAGPFALTQAVVSSKLSYALASTEDRPNLVLMRQLDREITWSEFENVNRSPALIALSNSGRSAAVLASTANSIHVIGGLPDEGRVLRTIETAGSRITAIAVSDDARFVVAAFLLDLEASSSMLRTHDGESGTWLDLTPAAHVTALSFASNGRDIAIADSKPASVSVLRNIEAISGITPVVAGTDGLAAPSAVRFGSNSRILIATASGVSIVQLNDNTRFDIACGCVPTALEELEGIFTFRVTDLTREPLWLLNESTDGLQLVFIPPPVQPEPTEGPVQ